MEVQKYRLRPVRARRFFQPVQRRLPMDNLNFSIPRASESWPPGYRGIHGGFAARRRESTMIDDGMRYALAYRYDIRRIMCCTNARASARARMRWCARVYVCGTSYVTRGAHTDRRQGRCAHVYVYIRA